MILSFMGVIGSGKDFQAQRYVKDHGFVRLDFKDALLDMACDLVGYDVREDYDFFKENIVGIRRKENAFLRTFDRISSADMERLHPSIMTGRRLLQRLGTDVMRKRDPKYWTKIFKTSAIKLLYKGQDMAVADCRFINEVRAIQAVPVDSKFIFCDYRSPRYDPSSTHESEKLAQTLLKCGMQDGQEITPEDFENAASFLKMAQIS